MSVISMKQLLEAGVHFGHQTRRWNPKMAPYIFTERNGIYIIDLQKTVRKIDEAYNFMKEVAASGKPILFVRVGTGGGWTNHHPKFTADPNALAPAAEYFAALAERCLRG